MTQLQEVCLEAIAEAKKAVLQTHNLVRVNRQNIQTEVDVVSQSSIITVLKKRSLSCILYSEELDEPLRIGDGRYEIVLDPIDGSFMFLHGITTYTSIAMSVLEERKVKYSFVLSIPGDDLYHCDEHAAYLNGEPLVCDTKNVPEPYFITGYAARKELADIPAKLAKLSSDYYFINDGGPKLGALVAANQLDAAMEFKPSKFHEFAGALIAQKAGAFVETIEGGPIVIDPLTLQTLITTRSEKLLRELQKALSST